MRAIENYIAAFAGHSLRRRHGALQGCLLPHRPRSHPMGVQLKAIHNYVGSLLMATIPIRFDIACIHGAFRDPEYLLLSGFGLFSFISGTGSTASACIPGVLPKSDP
nr:PRA1 family protein B3-like [Ipomoea batatas]